MQITFCDILSEYIEKEHRPGETQRKLASFKHAQQKPSKKARPLFVGARKMLFVSPSLQRCTDGI